MGVVYLYCCICNFYWEGDHKESLANLLESKYGSDSKSDSDSDSDSE